MRRHLPSLNALRAFEAAARHGTMTAAAEELCVTHGAVSRQVRQLEETLGLKLFEGPKSRPRLTAAGARLLPSLTGALDLMERGLREVAARHAGELSVSCLGTFSMRWLIPRLHRFQARHPEIKVRLTAGDGPVDFSREPLDLAIRVIPKPWPAGAETTPFLPEAVGPVMAPALAGAIPLVRPGDLAHLPRLHTLTRPAAWSDWCRTAGAELADEAAGGTAGGEYEHFYFMLEAAAAGLGVAISPWPLVIDDLAEGTLVAPFGFRPSGLDYVALAPAGPRNPERDALVAWLVEEGATTSPAPGGNLLE